VAAVSGPWEKKLPQGECPMSARLGKRRAEMIARNRKVEPQKRAEKGEMSNWFRIWLETPDAFFSTGSMCVRSRRSQGKISPR